jgi:endonuclease III
MKISIEKLKRVARLLIRNRIKPDPDFWKLPIKKRASKKQSNKFLLSVIMSRRDKAVRVWKNAGEVARKLGHPASLWHSIRSDYTRAQWRQLWKCEKYHRLGVQMAECVYDSAAVLVNQYGGDARKIWEGRDNPAIKHSLLELPGVGQKIANMTIGGLLDTAQITNRRADIAPDTHTCRVIGRVFHGEKCTEDEAIKLAREMRPANPWPLDGPLYFIGQDFCKAQNPDCSDCYLMRECVYCAKNKR